MNTKDRKEDACSERTVERNGRVSVCVCADARVSPLPMVRRNEFRSYLAPSFLFQTKNSAHSRRARLSISCWVFSKKRAEKRTEQRTREIKFIEKIVRNQFLIKMGDRRDISSAS